MWKRQEIQEVLRPRCGHGLTACLQIHGITTGLGRQTKRSRTGREHLMSKTKARAGKPTTCVNCAGSDLQRRITTYPAKLSGPTSLAGMEIRVGRVPLHECQSCGHLMPTPAGQAKVDRWVVQRIRSCERPGCYEVFLSTSGSPRQKFCSKECQRAMKRVAEREQRWQKHPPRITAIGRLRSFRTRP